MKLLLSPSNEPGFNLAAEEYIFSQQSVEALFVYRNLPSVVVGSNQSIYNEVDLNFCTKHSVAVYRRISGGGAVFHDLGNFNYCRIGTAAEGRLPFTEEVLYLLIDVMNHFDVPLHMGSRKDLWLPTEEKVSGTAAHIRGKRVLHHGTLLYDAQLDVLNQALLAPNGRSGVLGKGVVASVPSPVKNIRSYIENTGKNAPATDVFYRLWVEKIQEVLQTETGGFDADDRIEIERIRRSKMETDAWIYKK
ncbi:MAG TPA: hypothetical protein VJ871_08025 [Bacteroidales bacterium]|jgi:lipoate-protein ligase A|nr:hypothetical protein [Bacteroidales bacterium]